MQTATEFINLLTAILWLLVTLGVVGLFSIAAACAILRCFKKAER